AIVLGPAADAATAPAATRGTPDGGATPRAGAAVASGLRWVGSEFEPVWWLVRAFVIASIVALVAGGVGSGFSVLAALGILVASIVIGVRRRRNRTMTESASVRTARGIGVVVLGIGSLLVLLAIVDRGAYSNPGPAYVESNPVTLDESAGLGMSGPNGPVYNLYAFDAGGNRLTDVRLFDQYGMPLNLGASVSDPSRRLSSDSSSSAVYNAFPIRYYEPGTTIVADPDAGWPASPGALGPVAPPSIAAPPSATAKQ
ncbi:MAG: hypothetical protein H7287_02675, partial [Thermoleophilia bacterium]|nr:hypothetical protein [Thermoleophilia bacterium]